MPLLQELYQGFVSKFPTLDWYTVLILIPMIGLSVVFIILGVSLIRAVREPDATLFEKILFRGTGIFFILFPLYGIFSYIIV